MLFTRRVTSREKLFVFFLSEPSTPFLQVVLLPRHYALVSTGSRCVHCTGTAGRRAMMCSRQEMVSVS
jgi:hypothetical protein